MSSFTPGSDPPNGIACIMLTLGPHQTTRTAIETRSPNMFLKPLVVYSHLPFTALRLDVPRLSCTPAKMANVPVSFQAISRPRLH